MPIEIDAKVPKTVRVDKLRFERILANLLENAREHAGGPIAGQGRDRMAATALPCRSTTPVPVSPAANERASSSASPAAARHGTASAPVSGLALVAEHAHAHGGEAWVEDRPGGGARFKVSFAEVS